MRPLDGSLDQTTPLEPAAEPTREPTRDGAPASVPPGYRFADVIGRGGMGEVVLAEDLELGRQVAVKRMRSASPSAEATARFLREARIASGIAVAMVAFPTLIHRPWLVLGGVLAGFLLPVGLEAAGLWPRTWGFEDGRLVITASAVHLDGLPAAILIVGANTAMVVVVALLVRSLAAMQRAGQRALEIQAWHLGRLLPALRPSPSPSPPPRRGGT